LRSRTRFAARRDRDGGGILTGGRVTLTDCVLSSNAAAMFGGAIFNSGTLTLVRSLVSNNAAEYRAGAIYSETGSTLTLDHANLFGNSSSVGGAIDNHDGTLSITASTLSGNVATGVHGGAGGNIINLYTITTVRNSIVVAGASGPNCYTYFNNEIVSAGNNVSDDRSCAAFFTQAGDLNGVPAGLSPNGLQDNGGPTATIALLATSPAVDAVSLQACAAEGARLTTDQRGMPRPSGGACDSGAFELTLYPTTLTLSAANPASLTA